MIKTHRGAPQIKTSPFTGIKALKEADVEEIVYCTREERDRLIGMARKLEEIGKAPDWLAVPVSFYTGMRRGEVMRATWNDMLLGEGRVVVPKSKTKKRRVLPMAAALKIILEVVPVDQRKGLVAKPPETGMNWLPRANGLIAMLRELAKKEPEATRIPPERIRWNAWRHTFGALLAQKGVGLDKISSWMGNTPDVCRRHYAQFVPRNEQDEDIDKL